MLATFSADPPDGAAMPNVVVPYVPGPLAEATMLNLACQGIVPRVFRMEGDFDYYLLLAKLWREDRPFVLVEHDVLPWPGAIAQLLACEWPWCALPYAVHGRSSAYLGCVKFEPYRLGSLPLPAELQHWRSLDLLVQRELIARGYREHRHGPEVGHMNLTHARTPAGGYVTHPKLWKDEEKP